MKLNFSLLVLLSISLISLNFQSCKKTPEPIYLFNGIDLTGWDSWLGIPDSTQEVAGLAKKENGEYLESFGLNNDPLNIFSIVTEDDKPAIRIDGYVWGCLVTKEEYENYHLHLEYKWGNEKHPPRETLERNSGLCYHSVGEHGVFWSYWMRSFELEIKETALGDFVRVDDVFAAIETRVDTLLTTSPRLRYKPGGNPVQVSPSTYMVRASEDFEKPVGEWNSIDIYLLDDNAIHRINGEFVLVATSLQQRVGGQKQALTKGRIQLQSEGAEIFYRDIWMEPIDKLPVALPEETE